MLQDNYLGTEPQYMCGVCSQAVTNPICPFCLADQIDIWLTYSHPGLKEKISQKIKKYLDKVEDNIFDMTSCIKCGSSLAGVCPYCFTDFVLSLLKKIVADESVIKEFLEFFNYDEDHTGYFKEGVKLGVF